MKKLRYIGFIRVNGEIFRLPNCKHFSCGYTTSHVFSLLKYNVFEVFNKEFIEKNHIDFVIRDLKNNDVEFIEFFIPF